ncbi:TPA: hypothetical protein HA318_01815 [Candidatus Micrarchaeota archaeon]|nr:MAG: hypothetical protein AUJ65_01000 [Candidatus Micrarchaeota archaeon CG1_02_51_15]HII38720.1 hypothetical protein [Candidatus Micrarchaeota archaeon]
MKNAFLYTWFTLNTTTSKPRTTCLAKKALIAAAVAVAMGPGCRDRPNAQRQENSLEKALRNSRENNSRFEEEMRQQQERHAKQMKEIRDNAAKAIQKNQSEPESKIRKIIEEQEAESRANQKALLESENAVKQLDNTIKRSDESKRRLQAEERTINRLLKQQQRRPGAGRER